MLEKERVVILGGGVGGLAAAYFLARTGKYDVTLLEQASFIGGMCASFEHDGFVLDNGPHKMYSVVPGVIDELLDLMGDRVIRIEKKNRIWLRGRLLDYPLKLSNVARVLGPATFIHLGAGVALAMLGGLFNRKPERSYEEYILRRFGRPVYEMVFESLAEKVWGNPGDLHAEMARARIPASGGLEVILKLLRIRKETAETTAEFFHYPRRGFGDFPLALQERIEEMGGKVLTNARVMELDRDGNHITGVMADVDGETTRYACDYLISSIPLTLLGKLVFDDTDPELDRSVQRLQYRHLILTYIFVKRPLVLEDQWVYFPEREFVFSRIFEQKQMNPELGPSDRTSICCDFTSAEGEWQWQADDEALARRCIEGLSRARLIEPDEVTGFLVKRQRNFYPRYDLNYAETMKSVSNKLQRMNNLLLTGRIGMYNYNNSDHCMDMGRFIAENLERGLEPRTIWNNLEQRVATYRIVD